MNHDHLLEDLDLDLDLESAQSTAVPLRPGARNPRRPELLAPAERARSRRISPAAPSAGANARACGRCTCAWPLRWSQPREGFTGEVMRALVPAPWEARAAGGLALAVRPAARSGRHRRRSPRWRRGGARARRRDRSTPSWRSRACSRARRSPAPACSAPPGRAWAPGSGSGWAPRRRIWRPPESCSWA